MRYVSTRGGGGTVPFEQALLSAYAPDGGLYVPESLPRLTATQLTSWAQLDVGHVCARLLELFTELTAKECEGIGVAAFASFNTCDSADDDDDPPPPAMPLTPVGDMWLLDASLGPTLAFKDVGQQVVARLLEHYLSRRAAHANIVIETSGDTGPAAIAAVRGLENVSIFCIYPRSRVTPEQELQMVTVHERNVTVFRTDGDTDEQARALKTLFSDAAFMSKNGVVSVNSINWARIVAQISYYIWAALQLDPTAQAPVAFVVPTGAFGNALSGYIAKLMGVHIGGIVCATNANDIVHRTISRGDMCIGPNVQTLSPAMDIQLAYNLERLLYFATCGDTVAVHQFMTTFSAQGTAHVDSTTLKAISSVFCSASVSDGETLATMREMAARHGVVLDPHSAVGVHAANSPAIRKALKASGAAVGGLVCIVTAHPAKFSDTMVRAGLPAPRLHCIEKLRNLPRHFRVLGVPRDGGNSDAKVAMWAAELRRAVEDEARTRRGDQIRHGGELLAAGAAVSSCAESHVASLATAASGVAPSPLVYHSAAIAAVMATVPPSRVIDTVAHGFVEYSAGRVSVPPPQTMGQLPLAPFIGHSDAQACVKSGYIHGGETFVTKIASGGGGLNSGIMLVFSQRTFAPLAVLLDGGLLTELRTAAAGALAARLFAPRHPGCIGVIGCGVQARYQLRMLAAVTSCRTVKLWARRPAQAETLALELQRDGWHALAVGSAREACVAAGIIVTVTPSRSPLVEYDWLKGRRVLVVAIGADAPGKQELDVEVVAAADLLIVDSRTQCAERGESQHAAREGKIALSASAHGGVAEPKGQARTDVSQAVPQIQEIGECVGCVQGMGIEPNASGVRALTSDDCPCLVIFDSTGVAVQDVVIAELALDELKAREMPPKSRL